MSLRFHARGISSGTGNAQCTTAVALNIVIIKALEISDFRIADKERL
jgi:hypothetical protein